MLPAFLWGGFAAASLLIGYALAWRGLSHRNIGIVMGIGSGALISAIAYELVPESVFGNRGIALMFGLGAIVFFLVDWIIDHRGGAKRTDINGAQTKGSGTAIYIGTLLDAVPESIILGMSLAIGGAINIAFLSAVFISNLPEGVAGSINLNKAGYSRRSIYWMWVTLVIISAAFSAFGYFFISVLPAANGIHAQAFAAGAMLTMLADAMMPEAFEHGGMTVGLFTVLGYLLGALLSMLQ